MVDALAVRQADNFLLPIRVRSVIDAVRGSELLCSFKLFVGRRGDYDGGTERRCDLRIEYKC